MAPKKPAAVDAVPALLANGEYVVPAAAVTEPVEELPVDVGGWFLNTTAGPLTVMGAPSMTIPAGAARHLPYTPAHGGLVLVDEPPAEPQPDQAPETGPTPVNDKTEE